MVLGHPWSGEDRHLRTIARAAHHTPRMRRPAGALDHGPAIAGGVDERPSDLLVRMALAHRVDTLQQTPVGGPGPRRSAGRAVPLLLPFDSRRCGDLLEHGSWSRTAASSEG